MDDDAAATRVDWLPWGPRAFRAAAHLDRPVLLFVRTPWCGPCTEMDETTWADPGVAANVNDAVVPVRVDADRRPRVRERYAAGGFPATTALTPDGSVIAGAGHLDPAGLRRLLARVRERWRAAGADAGRVPDALADPGPPGGSLDGSVERLLAGQLRAQWDDEHGGWGTATKFPLPDTVRFALKREPALAERVLDRVLDRLQAPDGAVYRYAAADWTEPSREVLTDTTGGVLAALADAYLHTGADRFLAGARAAADALTGPLWVDGTVAASRTAPDHGATLDRTPLADRTAVAATGLCRLAAYTDDAPAGAAATLLGTLADMTADGLVAHHPGPDAARGLLGDQARLLEARVTAAQVHGREHVGPARAVADATLETLQAATGALRDGPADPSAPGLLDRPLYPLDGAAVTADALVTLAELTDTARYRRAAREMLAAFAAAADRVGVQAARYGTAAARTVDRPLTVLVGVEAGAPLHRAALRVADHEKVVVPGADVEPGTARLRGAGEADGSEPLASPEALLAAVRDRTG